MGPQDLIMLAYTMTQLSEFVMNSVRLSGELTEEQIQAEWLAQKAKFEKSVDLWNK